MNHHTPMMKQYLKFKKEHTDKILFFRLGDFYEMFYDDAKIVAKELNLTLTSKEVGKNNPVPLAGIPVHAADSYLSKLLKKGYKIAICDQVEDPAQSKGLVKREITRIITPGTITETNILDEKNNNFFMSICTGENAYGFAYVDISTGEFYAGEYRGKASLAKIKDEFYRLQPSEILADKKTYQLLYRENGFSENCIPPAEGEHFFHPYHPSLKIISNKFPHIDQELLGQQHAIIAAAAALRYLTTLQKDYLSHINKITCCLDDSFMQLDNITIRNLELLVTIREGKKSGGLLEIIDFTDTAMGGRMLKNWLVKPLTKLELIQDRQSVIYFLKENDDVLISVKKILQHIYDLERLTTRLTLGHINPRDLLALRNSLQKIPLLKQKLANGPKYLISLICSFPDLQELVILIDSAINEDAPLSLKEGNIIKAGYDQEIDRLREIRKKGKTWLLDLEQKERGKTGIKSLKVSFNKVFGYYIEVTKPNLPQVPDYYIRKQTLVNAERFITEELKNFENEIFGAQEKLYQLEYNIFEKIRKKAASYSAQLQQIANIIANIDCLCSLAMAALRYNYCQPYFNKEGLIKIKQGRHPVVEQTLQAERFIPNDLEMNNKNKIHIITGPNMAGKSTYCRSIALIV
ncbi:MAG: DNA mismatch repair protein MutS, partial [Firmicutes bacterium]|nr:DNA mismatch repair protein MutS [Bacillota bacterium]